MCFLDGNTHKRFLSVALTLLFALVSTHRTFATCTQASDSVAQVTIFGFYKTVPHILLRELDSRPGGQFSWERVDRDRIRLLNLDIIRDAEVQVKQNNISGGKTLVYIVSESNPWYIMPSLGNDNLYGLYAGFKAGYKNLRGRREKLEFETRFGRLQKYRLAYSNPWFGGPLHLFTTLELKRELYLYIFGDYWPVFRIYSNELAFTLGFRPVRKIAIGITASHERIAVNHTPASFSGTGTDKMPSCEPFIEIDTRDWQLYPQRGWYAKASYQKYLDSAISFARTSFDVRRTQSLPGNKILVLRVWSILSRGSIPVYKRAHLGGSKNLRGYYTGKFAGDNVLAGSAEWRLPIGFQPGPQNSVNIGTVLVFFVDTGTTWWQGEHWESKRFHSSVGVGFHFLLQEMVFSIMYGNTGKNLGFLHLASQLHF